jgi:hypothetical protein
MMLTPGVVRFDPSLVGVELLSLAEPGVSLTGAAMATTAQEFKRRLALLPEWAGARDAATFTRMLRELDDAELRHVIVVVAQLLKVLKTDAERRGIWERRRGMRL